MWSRSFFQRPHRTSLRVKKIFSLAVYLCLLPVFAFAAQPFSLDGYYKSFFVVFNLPEYKSPFALPEQPARGAVNNRLRLKFSGAADTRLSFHVAYDLSPRIQDPLLFENNLILTGIDPLQYRARDFNARLYPAAGRTTGSVGVFHNLDRATLELKTAPADFILGRQAIAWGSARVLNPTDVLAPFTFQELDTEERIGVDALRVRVPLGALAELDAGYVFGKDFQFKHSAFFLRHKFSLAQTDVALLLVEFRENVLAGIDLAGSLGGAGFWLEAAHVFVNTLNDEVSGNERDYFRGTVGVDYSLSSKTYGFIEYHFNDAGSGMPAQYLQNLSHSAFTEGAVYLMGRHYLAPGVTYQFMPLLTLSAQALLNLRDRSAFLTSQAEYNLAQNVYLSAGFFIGMGRRPEIARNDTGFPSLQFRSEFGGYPDIYFSSFRVYF